ncbi:MAG: T9SS type A sorting domain-containing protein [Bacteroidales bacterium]|nr:T9SS type A sorting domain-containing protein [Bacteroidales bacterium]
MAGVWEILNDCSVQPLFSTGDVDNTSLLPDIEHIERAKGWRYFPTEISGNGHYILAVAINNGQCEVCFNTEPGDALPVFFKLKNNYQGRVIKVLSYIGVKDISEEKSNLAERTEGKLDETTLQLYPNPARGMININLGSSDDATLTIYNHLGKVVGKHYISENLGTLDISGLLPGMYYVKASNSQYTVTTTLVVR